jgi:hypothetical protein
MSHIRLKLKQSINSLKKEILTKQGFRHFLVFSLVVIFRSGIFFFMLFFNNPKSMFLELRARAGLY